MITGVRQLYLDSNNLAAEEAASLAPSLTVMIGLQQLHLASNNIGAEDMAVLINVTSANVLWLF